MNPAEATVVVIDDDAGVRSALQSLLRSVGFQVAVFGSVPDFLDSKPLDGPSCLVLDVNLPGGSGLDLQNELVAGNVNLPIIFITGYGDIPTSVRAMKAGAVEFLTKPFRDRDLLDAIDLALERDRARLDREHAVAGLRQRYESLTMRERQVMAHVVAGRLNKQIAADIGLSEITVKVHRGHVMQKMGARSVADLVRMADRLDAADVTSSSRRAAPG